VGLSDIMSKMFYVVVPFYTIERKNNGFLKNILAATNKKRNIQQKHEDFETFKNQLFQRAEQINAQLSSMGIKGVILRTEELIELYYNSYNPSEFEYVDLENVNSLDLEK
jgi:predicted nucleotide-binding protein (sugar kinase/HSP70/actin superfamily)